MARLSPRPLASVANLYPFRPDFDPQYQTGPMSRRGNPYDNAQAERTRSASTTSLTEGTTSCRCYSRSR